MTQTPEGKDPQLWEIAQRRASFKTHLATYIVMSAFFWIIWFFTSQGASFSRTSYPWPIWPMLGWGIGVFFHYLGAYVYPKSNSIEKEYQKQKQEQQKQ